MRGDGKVKKRKAAFQVIVLVSGKAPSDCLKGHCDMSGRIRWKGGLELEKWNLTKVKP
jgi:hypothetical protein